GQVYPIGNGFRIVPGPELDCERWCASALLGRSDVDLLLEPCRRTRQQRSLHEHAAEADCVPIKCGPRPYAQAAPALKCASGTDRDPSVSLNHICVLDPTEAAGKLAVFYQLLCNAPHSRLRPSDEPLGSYPRSRRDLRSGEHLIVGSQFCLPAVIWNRT